MNSPKIKVAILDDDARLREHLVRLLKEEPDISVVAEAGVGFSGIKKVEEHKPDVILMGSNKPFTEGLEATRMIITRFPDTKILFLSMYAKTTMTVSSCQVGACFPLCKDCSTKQILSAIRESLPQG